MSIAQAVGSGSRSVFTVRSCGPGVPRSCRRDAFRASVAGDAPMRCLAAGRILRIRGAGDQSNSPPAFRLSRPGSSGAVSGPAPPGGEGGSCCGGCMTHESGGLFALPAGGGLHGWGNGSGA